MSVITTVTLINEAAANVVFSAGVGQSGTFQEYRDRSGSILAAQDSIRFEVTGPKRGKRTSSASIRIFYPIVVGTATVYKFLEFSNGRYICPEDAPLTHRSRMEAYVKSLYANAGVTTDLFEQLDCPRA